MDHNILLLFLFIPWITFISGFENEVNVSFKPTLITVDSTTGDVYAAGPIDLAHFYSNLTIKNQLPRNYSRCKTCEIRVLEIDYRARKLLVCGVTDKGSCTFHDLEDISNYTLLKPYSDSADTIGSTGSVVALFLNSSQSSNSELVIGVSQPLDDQINLLSFRQISSGYLTYLSTDSNNKLQILEELKKIVEVHFVYAFQFEDGLYFLVNKRGNNGTSSWLFQICSKEKSVFPFVAIPLSCQRTDVQFQGIVQMYNLAFAARFYAYPSQETLVVSFGYNKIENHTPNEMFGSAVCTFLMKDIKKELDYVKITYGNDAVVSIPKWIKGICSNYSGALCDKKGYQVSIVSTAKTLVQIVEDQLITSVIPFTVNGQLHILTSTSNGDLYYYRKDTEKTQILSDQTHKTTMGLGADVEIDERHKTAYAMTDHKIVKISLDFCTKHISCEECVRNKQFRCVWFKGQCLSTDRNTGGLENTCSPEITSINPNSGITSVRNLVTIHGKYLGSNEALSRTVRLCNTTCIVNRTLSDPSKIVCHTEKTSEEQLCNVTVDVNDRFSSPLMMGRVTSGNNTKLYFQFKSVSVNSFDPELGPESGGTNITITGENIDLIKTVVIEIDDSVLPCLVTSFNETLLFCTTASLDNQGRQYRKTNESIGCGKISLRIGNDLIAETNGTFCYWKDPEITNISPRRSIKSGGLDVSVEGTNLNVIANPRLGIALENSDVQPDSEDCKARSSTTMICKTPSLSSLVANDTSTSGDIYFIMDGVKELNDFAHYHPNLSEIKVNPDPEFAENERFNSLDRNISIKGTNLKESEVLGEDIQVTITSDAGTRISCPVSNLGEDAVSCQPNITSSVTNETHFVVQVKVGNRYYKVGNIYVNTKDKKQSNEADINLKLTSYGIIVGVALAVVICIILISCLIWCVCRQKKEDKMRHMFMEMSESAADSHLTISGVQQVKHLMDAKTIIDIEKANLFINSEKLSIGEVIGAGNFGCVCEGILKEENDLELKVAVKTLQDTNAEESNLKEFVKEALLMKDFEHNNVLKLIGITLSKDSLPHVVLPFMENGDLLKYVADEEKTISLTQMIMFAIDISRGMEYLGSLKFVHRDLAARNCMLDNHFIVKVADFGLTRDIYEKGYYHSENKKTKLPIRWMAIESIERGTYSSKSDVWSFGVVIWELLTRGVTPYPGVEGWDVIAYLRSGRRLRKPWFCDDKLYALMLSCWNEDIEARPAFNEVAEELDCILHDDETVSAKYGSKTDTFGKPVPNPPVLVTIPECYNYYESLSPKRDEPQQYFVLETPQNMTHL